MSGGSAPTTVSGDEVLARFILFSGWFRQNTVPPTPKQDAFIPRPPPDLDLSVTRHIEISVSELWAIGQAVAAGRPNATLYGRADIAANHVLAQSLTVAPTATPKNHANILGWPLDKPGQKIIALQLAAAATFVPR